MILNSLGEVAEILQEKNNILILTHANPDGDTIGSACALCLCLRQMGKNANVAYGEGDIKKYEFLTKFVSNADFLEDYVISVDVADKKLLGKTNEEKYENKIDLAIDHHESHRAFAKNIYVEGNSASCSEIIFLLIKLLGQEITPQIANCLFTGVSTDTGCFRYTNVTSRTHSIASELINFGAEAGKINERMFEIKTFAQLKLQKLCLENLKLFANGKMSLFVILQSDAEKTGCSESDFDLIVALSRQIEGVCLGVTLKEKADGSIKASVRTNEEVDAAEFCSFFGGGGHKRAAGCSFSCSMEEAKMLVVQKGEQLLLREN